MDIVLENIIIGKADTTANWTSDATIYSLGFMMISSDATYSGTNVKKWKIANGVDTWTNIDFVPVAETLAKILLKDNKTGGEPIHSDDEYSVLKVINNEIALFIDDGATGGANFLGDYTRAKMRFVEYATFKTGEINIDISRTYIKHSDLIELAAPTINLPQSTASRIVETDASKNLTYAAKGTAYNKDFGTTAGTVCEGNDTRLSDARNGALLFKQNVTLSLTGTITPTIIASFPIPLNFNQANDFVKIWGMAGVDVSGGAAGNNQIRFYIGPNPTDLIGSQYIAAMNNTTTLRTYPISRTLVFKNSLTDFELSANHYDVVQSDYATHANAPTLYSIDFTTQKYFHVVGILNNTGNIISIRSLYAQLMR